MSYKSYIDYPFIKSIALFDYNENIAMVDNRRIPFDINKFIEEEEGTIIILRGIVTDTVNIVGKKRISLIGDRAVLKSNVIINNSFMTRITGFKLDGARIVIMADETWSESSILENLYLDNGGRIEFKSPTGSGAGSYVNTFMRNIMIELRNSGDKGIVVEKDANIGDSLLMNLHIWHHSDNTVGIDFNGKGRGALVVRPTFESFVSSPTSVYGINIGPDAQYPPELMKPSWLGEFTSRVYNPNGVWLFTSKTTTKNEVSVPVGTNNNYGDTVVVLGNRGGNGLVMPIIRIEVGGTFASGEEMYVEIVFELIDGSETSITSGPWTSTGGYTLSLTDLFGALPSNNVIWAIKARAKSNQSTTNVTVTIKASAWQ